MSEFTSIEEVLPELPGLIADKIKARLPDLRECAPHAGKFDLAEIKAFSARAPAVRVALLGIERRKQGEHVLKLAAFVVTQDASGLPRDRAALAITGAIMRRIIGTAWGLEPWLGESDPPDAVNLYDSGGRTAGIALWAVRWDQPVLLVQAVPEEGPLLKSLYFGIAPEIGLGHEPDYELIAGEERR